MRSTCPHDKQQQHDLGLALCSRPCRRRCYSVRCQIAAIEAAPLAWFTSPADAAITIDPIFVPAPTIQGQNRQLFRACLFRLTLV